MTHGIDGTAVALDVTDRHRTTRPAAAAVAGVSAVGAAGAAPPGEAYAGWQPVRRAERQQGVERLLLPADVVAMLAVALGTGADLGMWLAAPVMVAASYGVFGLYRPRLTLSVLDDLPRLLAGVAVAAGTGLTFSGPRPDLPAAYALRTILAGAAAVVLIRVIGYPLARRSRRRRLGAPTLIVGGAQVGCQLGQILLAQPEYGLLPVGYLDTGLGGRRRGDLPAPLLGDHRDLAWLLAALEVRHVVVAFGAVRSAALVDVLRTCARMRCEILVVPRLFELHQRTRDADHVRGIPLVRMRPAAPRRPTWRLKRLMDVAVAAPALLLASPVLAVCALAVRLEGGPGVLFRQERVGLDGRRFEILKLRSLRPASARESQVRWTVAGDRRLGPVGRVLRATSLDELPQLVNVLRGEMSLVGPRPERPYFVEQFGRQYPRYADRHRVPAGLTGWAAVNGLRGDTSIDDRIRYDNNYIEDWSLWFDIKIMVRTLGAILTRAGG